MPLYKFLHILLNVLIEVAWGLTRSRTVYRQGLLPASHAIRYATCHVQLWIILSTNNVREPRQWSQFWSMFIGLQGDTLREHSLQRIIPTPHLFCTHKLLNICDCGLAPRQAFYCCTNYAGLDCGTDSITSREIAVNCLEAHTMCPETTLFWIYQFSSLYLTNCK
jgi:hypothetical protein